jgi:uncharacterized delta-60 repeat protein
MLAVSLSVVPSTAFGTPAAATPSLGLDASFGGDGKVQTDFTKADDIAYAVAVQANGKIVAAGVSSLRGRNTTFAIARYNTDGTRNTSFGDDGKVQTNFTRAADIAKAAAIQSDGKIVVAGVAGSGGSNAKFALARYDSDGSLDTSFGGDGKVTTDLSPDADVASCLAIQSDGKIVVAGVAGSKLALARYNADGTLDTSFGGDGQVTDLDGYGTALAIQTDGKIVASSPLARYNADGSLDASFGTGGVTSAGFDALAIQADGKIIGGWTDVQCFGFQDCDYNFVLDRYNTDGTLDSTFGYGGEAVGLYGVLTAVAMQGDGKIVAVGYSGSQRGPEFVIDRFNTDGTQDAIIGTNFTRDADRAYGVAIQVDGKIVLSGSSAYSRKGSDAKFALARYGP